jgi:hypothetical protein
MICETWLWTSLEEIGFDRPINTIREAVGGMCMGYSFPLPFENTQSSGIMTVIIIDCEEYVFILDRHLKLPCARSLIQSTTQPEP